jgi:hypothetical protein
VSERRARGSITRILLIAVALAGDVASGASEQDVALVVSDAVSGVPQLDVAFRWDDHVSEQQDDNREALTLGARFPVGLTERWRLISDTRLEQGGDLQETLLFSPNANGSAREGLAWGAGIVVGSGGVGPALTLVQQNGRQASGITFDEHSDVLHIDAFTTWALERCALSLAIEAEYDRRDDRTTLPVQLSGTRAFRVGRHFFALAAEARYYVDVPQGPDTWGLGLRFSLLSDFD